MGLGTAPSVKAAGTVLSVIARTRAARLPDAGNVVSTGS
jgi:hypothetical protein